MVWKRFRASLMMLYNYIAISQVAAWQSGAVVGGGLHCESTVSAVARSRVMSGATCVATIPLASIELIYCRHDGSCATRCGRLP
jgi:hypothetical protein